ncbi:MAG: methyltransferase domain-containing protein [Candidatus Eremiobacteraeota bacterium]|nr:methyltransferase domain-containing protein [Candidatus Eremiobacteraeota bacterium]
MNEDEHALIRAVYDRRAPYYNRLVNLLSCGQDHRYRAEAVSRLNLKKGDRVLDLGCGTGLNFGLIHAKVGENGLIVGIDSSLGMLRKAREAAKKCSMGNAHLIAGDVSEVVMPRRFFDAIVATYLFSTIPDYQQALEHFLGSLKQGGTFVLADDILPAGWFAGPLIMGPWLLRHGWVNYSRQIIRYLRKAGGEVKVTWHHGGLIYIVSGKKV